MKLKIRHKKFGFKFKIGLVEIIYFTSGATGFHIVATKIVNGFFYKRLS